MSMPRHINHGVVVVVVAYGSTSLAHTSVLAQQLTSVKVCRLRRVGEKSCLLHCAVFVQDRLGYRVSLEQV